MNRPLIALYTGTLWLSLLASEGAAGSLVDYLRHTVARSPDVRSAEAQLPYRARRWHHERAWFVPDSELTINLSEQNQSAESRSEESDVRELEWTTGLTLPIGSKLSLIGRAEEQNAQPTLDGTTLPESNTHTESLTLEITQPLLHGWRRSVTGAPADRARALYQRDKADVLQAQRIALRQAIETLTERAFQRARLALESDLLDHRRALRTVAESAFASGAITAEARDRAYHTWLRQLSRYREARQALQEARDPLFRSEPSHRATRPPPDASLSELAALLAPANSGAVARPPPEVLMSRYQVVADRAQREASRYRHWPELALFVEHQERWADPEPDRSSTRVGMRFRYQLFPRSARDEQLRHEARLEASNQRRRTAALDWQRSLQHTERTLQRLRQRQEELQRHRSRQIAQRHRVERSYRAGEESLTTMLQTLASLADTERDTLRLKRDRVFALLDWTLLNNGGNLEPLISERANP